MAGFRLGLLTRIALALLVMGFLPLLLAWVLLTRINQDSFQDQVLQTHGVAASTAARRVDGLLSSLGSVAEAVAGNPAVSREPAGAVTNELLSGLLQAQPELQALILMAEDGAQVGGVRRAGLREEIDRIVAELTDGGVQVVEGNDHSWLVIRRPLATALGSAVLFADARLLDDMLRSDELGEAASLILASTGGRTLAGDAALETFPRDLIDMASTRQLSGAGAAVDQAGEEILGAFAPVERSDDWFVLSRQPARLAERIERAMRRDQLLTLGLAGLLASLLSTLAYYTVVKPLRRVAAAQRRLAGLTNSPADGDEISDLSNSFKVIERRVREKEEIGKVFLGRYQVIEVLGEGAMGTVFRGWDPRLQRQVALKTVRLGTETTSERRRQEMATQIFREATTAARINHPHIVSIFDVEHVDDVAFLAMEFIEGIGLDRLLWFRGSLEPGQAAALGLAMAKALAASHRHKVVHRDVKPSNVLLGFDGTIKVADFGIAELISSMGDPGQTFFGTPGYVPPETLRGEGYTERGDLFALGIVLYECLTGYQPFSGENVRDTALRTLKHHPDAPIRLKPQIPGELSDLVERLLDKDPLHRPDSAAQVVEYLEQLAAKRGYRWDPAHLPEANTRALPETVPRSQILPTFVISSTTRSME